MESRRQPIAYKVAIYKVHTQELCNMLQKQNPTELITFKVYSAVMCCVPTAVLEPQPRRLPWVLDRATNQNPRTGAGWQSILAVTECCLAPMHTCGDVLRDSLPLQGWLSRPQSVRQLLPPPQAKVQHRWSASILVGTIGLTLKGTS